MHERRAFNADRAQIGRRFVEHKLQSLAIEFGVAFLGKNERALTLAVGDEQLDLNERLAATRNGIWVIGVGKAIEQHLDAARFTFEGLLDFDEQLALAAQSPHLALHLGLALKHGIAAPQALLRCSKRLAALIDRRDVFGQNSTAAAHGINLEQRMRRPCRAKRPRLAEPLIRRFQGVRRSLGHRLRHFGLENRIAICLEHLQIEGQLGKRQGIPRIRRKEAQIEREFYGHHGQNAIGKRDVRRQRRNMAERKHYTVNNTNAHDNANREKHAAKASARREEQRGEKYYEQHDIPGHEHVVAKSVAIVATPIGVGEIEGEYEMVHVVRKHGKHGER